jgi:hypothetical protein
VTVTAEASLLKTETGELADNVTIDQMDALPMLGIGTINSGTSGFRNPYNTLLTLPGVSGYSASGTFEINGLGAAFVTTETMRTEGQDATSRLFGVYDYTQMAQPSVDSVQEIAYQTSNYAPEFGAAGSVVINMTMKSGTNQYHGTGYDYFVNEDLNAGDPYTVSGTCETGVVAGQKNCGSSVGGDGGKFRPRNRRNDFGGTLGGPIYIPKIYNGHNKSFFFFNYEEFLETDFYGFNDTVPTAQYLAGNFSSISPNGNCSLCAQQGIQTAALGSPVQVDPIGQNIYANEIFNPLSRAEGSNGQGYATPFVNNSIPATMFDPTMQKILSFVPAANQPSNLLTGNYVVTQPGKRYSAIPAFKIDHNIDAKDKLSFYYSENTTANQFNPTLGNMDGMPNTITNARGSFITNYQERLNYDRTLSPTLLLHLGAGLYHQSFVDNSPELTFNDNTQLGITGNLVNRNFPTVATVEGLQNTGGLQGLGPGDQNPSYEMRPTGTSSLTWVHGKHTFKFGGEWIYEQAYSKPFPLISLTSGAGPTQDPFTTSNLGAFNDGFAFASFLLGDMVGTNQTVNSDTRFATMDWAVYLQDSWKVTRKLTLDYGLRWDYDTPDKEQYGRAANLNATGPNLNAGGEPGNYQYAATCGCQFYKSAYPLALGPRLGVAYQIDPKTVFRGGWGVNYQFVSNAAGATVGTAGAPNVTAVNPAYIPAAYQFINMQAPGVIATPTWPVIGQNGTTSIYPLKGSLGSSFLGTGPTIPDGQENRPPRINQWSAGFQREITKSFIMEASYVANHAVWLQPFGAGLGFLTQLSPTYLATWGLYPTPGTGPAGYNNEADRLLLTEPLSSGLVQQKLASIGRAGYLPYNSFPTSTSLGTALSAYPQYAAFGPPGVSGSPTGGSKYNSLQMKATKRLSHGLQAGGSFTWGQGFNIAGRQDFWNPQSAQWALQNIPPLTLNFNAVYTVPRASFFPKALNQVTKDWQLGFFANYQSGAYLTPPASTVNSNYLGSEDIRVAGQPLYTSGVNPNNQSTYNPYYTQLLNPAAWAPCPSNADCMASGNLYKDFRAPRTPTENANIARNFRIKERMNFQIRGEFVNIFNRTLLPGPSTSNPQAPVTKNNLGIQTGGFGVITAFYAPNTAPPIPTGATQPYWESRQGTLIGRFSF